MHGHRHPLGQGSALYPRPAGIGHGLIDPGAQRLGKPVASNDQAAQGLRRQAAAVDFGQHPCHPGTHFGLGMEKHQRRRLAHHRMLDLQHQPAEVRLHLGVANGQHLQNRLEQLVRVTHTLCFEFTQEVEQRLFGVGFEIRVRIESREHPPTVGFVQQRQNFDPGSEQFLGHHGPEMGKDAFGKNMPGQSRLPELHALSRPLAPPFQVDPQDLQGIAQQPQPRIEPLGPGLLFGPADELSGKIVRGALMGMEVAAQFGLAETMAFKRYVVKITFDPVFHPP